MSDSFHEMHLKICCLFHYLYLLALSNVVHEHVHFHDTFIVLFLVLHVTVDVENEQLFVLVTVAAVHHVDFYPSVVVLV